MLDYQHYFALKLRALFPDPRVQHLALRELGRYGTAPHELETYRVRLAILKLSGGSIAEVKKHVDGAKEDFRDILAWSENPIEMKVGMANQKLIQEERSRIQKADRKQFEEWLAKD